MTNIVSALLYLKRTNYELNENASFDHQIMISEA